METEDYKNVVLKDTRGFYTWTSYQSDEELKDLVKHTNSEIMARDISTKEAIEICEKNNEPLLENAIGVMKATARSLKGLADLIRPTR